MTKIPEYEFGAHIFMWARPIEDETWSSITNSSFETKDREWRPVEISGHNAGQSVFILGSAYAFPVNKFEFKEMG